ncbi:hypothetical protein [Jiangella mangrovi]|uniref:PhiRv1 phage protein n=1 Tax=Jiangella mangrovi TaxID=1524084 RepID=A0A7W9LJF7_9ACTN|nr:hypothetical protein [Jiangella mangrovi]MBB5785982.1 hypothetical protein [Jiangella mangrovi]
MYSARARHNALVRHRAPDDPEVVAARRELRAAALEDHIRKVVDQAPPLTTEQRDRLAQLLRPSVARNGGGAHGVAA